MPVDIIKKTIIGLGLIVLILVLVEAFLLWRLQRQRAEYKNYWLNRAQAEVPEDALWYVALGDSTAVGIGASKPQNGYVGLLEQRLHGKTGRPVHVINLGVTGARLKDLINDQLPALQKLNLPSDSVVTLAIGSNNIREFNSASFRVEFEELLKGLPKQTFVADVPYFGGGRANAKENNALEASKIIDELVRERQLKLVNLHKATKENDSRLNYAADFFHPNDRAYRIWADAFWGTMKY